MLVVNHFCPPNFMFTEKSVICSASLCTIFSLPSGLAQMKFEGKSLCSNFIGLSYSDKKIHYSASRNSFVGLIGTLMRNWSSNKM